MDVYVTNGTNIGRVIGTVWDGTTVRLVLERLDSKTLISVPMANATVVEVCTFCRYRVKQTDPATGMVVSDYCTADAALYHQGAAPQLAGVAPIVVAPESITVVVPENVTVLPPEESSEPRG